MGLFEKKETADEIKLQLAELVVKLAKVREQVGELSKECERLSTKVNDAQKQSKELSIYASKAVVAGNEQDAKAFLGEKYKFDQIVAANKPQLDEVIATRRKAVELHDKMVREVNDAKTRLAVLQARNAAADAQIKASQTVGSFDFEEDLSKLEADAELKQAMADAENYAKNGGDTI